MRVPLPAAAERAGRAGVVDRPFGLRRGHLRRAREGGEKPPPVPLQPIPQTKNGNLSSPSSH